jgi:uracil-DNA glycosylase family 4
MHIYVPPHGPADARVVIVGEAPGSEETRSRQPFVGQSGQELTRMLHEAKINRLDCLVMNVCPYQPPKNEIESWMRPAKRGEDGVMGYVISQEVAQGLSELEQRIAAIKPNLIIALGGTALWALSGEDSITSWRGSMMYTREIGGAKYQMIPTYHPAAILRVWEWRAIAVHDLRRAARWLDTKWEFPAYNIQYPMEFSHANECLDELIAKAETKPLKLAVDIETIRHEMACVGIASSKTDAVVFPFRTSKEYWTVDEEVAIIQKQRTLLTHPNVRIVGQNFLYDAQYFARQWGFSPRLVDDTMFQQHVLWAGSPKDLAYIASMYCEFYTYWKDELKDYRKAPDDDMRFFFYNAKDVCYTYEASDVMDELLDKANLREVYTFQMQLCHAVFTIMLRGVRIDKTKRGELATLLMSAADQRREFLKSVLGYDLNPRSPLQMKRFLYEEMGLPPVINRKTQRVSANFEAMHSLCEKQPLLYPLVDAILEQRSIGVFLNTFVRAELDSDGRMRCSYNPTGTETYRFASSANAFGSGTNLQNIPKGDRKKTRFTLPNIRELFIPDPGYTFFDVDLDRADLQVVVWEADDAELKQMLREGIDMHVENAKVLFNNPHLTKASPERQVAKQFVHGTNYGGSARTMAGVCGITVHQAELCQNRWFAAHKGIKQWHIRTERALLSTRTITNRFGYRRPFFGRIESVLPQALAWVPQSTVAIVINKGLVAVNETIPEIEILLQVHDSLGGQYLTSKEANVLPRLHSALLIQIPYPDPLTIPVGLKTSTKSWGECKDVSWPQ